MVDVDGKDEKVKRIVFLIIGVVAICVFLYSVFFVGAGFGCASGGGVLTKGVDGVRCIDINTTDLCRDYNGRVIEKPVGGFNFNVSYYNSSIRG